MSAAVLVWGTGPRSSKTHVAMGITRWLTRRGYGVLPFKAVTVVEGNEPASPLCVAAQRPWDPDLTPIVVERRSATTGELRGCGVERLAVGLATADTVAVDQLAPEAAASVERSVRAALGRLQLRQRPGDIIVAEGAGSPVDASDEVAHGLVFDALSEGPVAVVLTSYCWDGGSAASVVGTFSLLPDRVQRRVSGFVLSRPRLASTAAEWAARITQATGLAHLGTVPTLDGLPAGDAETTARWWADAVDEALGPRVLGTLAAENIAGR